MATAMKPQIVPMQQLRERNDTLEDLVTWLRAHGVGKRSARRFLVKTGCDSLHSIAVYLRFQLPPIHLAKKDCVVKEMQNLMDVSPKNAMAIVSELNVQEAVNVDINQEATVYLMHTGQLSQLTSIGHGGAAAAAADLLNRQSMTLGTSTHLESFTLSHMPVGPPQDNASSTVLDSLSRTPSAMSPVAPRQFSAGGAATRSTRAAPGRSNGLGPQAPPHKYAVYNNLFEQHGPQKAVPPAKPWIMVTEGSDAAFSFPASPVQQPSRDHSFLMGENDSEMHEPGVMLGPQMRVPRPLGEGIESPCARVPQQNKVYEPRPVAEGKDDYNKYLERKLEHKLDHKLERLNEDATFNTTMTTLTSIDLPKGMHTWPAGADRQGTSEALPSAKLPGVPTASGPLDPGAYHKANTMLRRQMPHYHAKVSVNVHWDHVSLWFLTIASVIMYVGTRLYYLISGKSATLSGGDVNIPFSWMTIVADAGLAVLGIYLHQNFWKQTVQFTPLNDLAIQKMNKEVKQKGMKETVHVLITTYTEPAVTVRECVLRLLVAPEPIYMEKMIYVCDDGHAKSEGPKKKAMVEELRILGHLNVFYVGDRVKRPDQLNGKSANLNHVLLHKIYPNVRKAEEVPLKDIFMVMDCDHMVKPDIFNKMGPTLLNPKMAVSLVPQCFHNIIYPDALDAANGDFMFGRLPFFFGAGVLFVTGTNVMVRCRPAFEVCKFADANAETSADGEDHRQLFTEDEISEDVVLGSRLHAAGFKGVFVAENLATGEVPLEARAMWRQRFRWFKGGHLFLLSPTSVFFEKSCHMSFYQKTLYWICLVANIMSIYADPILFMLPFICLTFDVCAYGMDNLLFWTHLVHGLIVQFTAVYYTEWARVVDALKAHVAFRVLWFTTVKACINTVMVMTGWKKSGVFKATPKLGEKAEEASARLPDLSKSENGSKVESSKGVKEKEGKGFQLHQVHDALSKVTEVRKKCMPFDGTLDFWVIMFITGSTMFAVISASIKLVKLDAFRDFHIRNQSLKWLAIVWGLHQAMPGIIFAGYLTLYRSFPRVLKLYVPIVVFTIFACILFIEGRIAYAFAKEFDCSKIAC